MKTRSKFLAVTVFFLVFFTISCKKKVVSEELHAGFTAQYIDAYVEAENTTYQVMFSANGSGINPEGTVYTYDFGDGDKSYSGEGSVAHEYQYPGSYTVILTVETKDGEIDTETQIIVIDAAELNVKTFYDTGIDCIDFSAAIFDSYQDCINNDNDFVLSRQVAENGSVIFHHLEKNKTYYIRIYANAVSGTGFYDNQNDYIRATKETNITDVFFTLIYHY